MEPCLFGEDLDLDVAGALDQLLEIDLVAAEGGLGLAAGGVDVVEEGGLVTDHPHPAPAAAPGGLEHEGIAIAAAMLAILVLVVGSGSLAGITGTPTETARLRAATLSPSRRMVSAEGPMKVSPPRRRPRRNPGFPTGSRSRGGRHRRPPRAPHPHISGIER